MCMYQHVVFSHTGIRVVKIAHMELVMKIGKCMHQNTMFRYRCKETCKKCTVVTHHENYNMDAPKHNMFWYMCKKFATSVTHHENYNTDVKSCHFQVYMNKSSKNYSHSTLNENYNTDAPKILNWYMCKKLATSPLVSLYLKIVIRMQ